MAEFKAGVTDDFTLDELSPISRKQFLGLLAASAAFATAGCTNYRDKGEIVPYTRKPEEITPGVANYYASTCVGCPQACGTLIKTREGRPVKIDGNPDHPINQGKLCAKGQASILSLYDPARLRSPQYGAAATISGDVSWNDVDADVIRQLGEYSKSGKAIFVLTPPVQSPTARRLLSDFAATFPGTQIIPYAFLNDEARRKAWETCYGQVPLPVILWEKAEIILALEADILGSDGFSVEQSRKFAAGRDYLQSQEFNRLYCAEASFSPTGANADYRLRLHPSAQTRFVLAILNEIVVKRKAIAGPPALRAAVGTYDLASFCEQEHLSVATVQHLVDDLLGNRKKAIVFAGPGLPEQVHLTVNVLNDLLGNNALYSESAVEGEATRAASSSEIERAITAMKSGSVGAVLHFGVNPVFDLPRTLGYAEALKHVQLSVDCSESETETGRLCTYVLPANNALESWGDHQVRTGVYSLQQPVIAPLYDSRQREAVLLRWMAPQTPYSETLYHTYLKSHWETTLFPALQRAVPFAAFWNASLHDGVVIASANTARVLSIRPEALSRLSSGGAGDTMALVWTESTFTGDGRFANNGWLQELPHPVTKVVWDNYVSLSPSTASKLGAKMHDLLLIKTPAGEQTLPAFVQSGMADNVVAVTAGYGRWNAGPVGSAVGADIVPLLPITALDGGRVLTQVEVKIVPGEHQLVTTQEHHSLDETFVKDFHLKRKIIRESTLEKHRRDPMWLVRDRHEYTSISKEVEYHGVKWAMAIDLNKCTGCNACVAGCNVENNVPVVGKEQVAKGREMQWIRIDRYFSGTPDEPVPSHQPMLCQQCDNAPCENVCPVVATNHSDDGLNQMVYNRCVGTKYCSNNCPFKVRRFNFYNFRDHFAEGYYQQDPISLVHNPEVTVRSRGVMEKCSFCVQRIMEARQHAAEKGEAFDGDGVRTACQDACPAQAIVFGNVNDPKSEIARYAEHDLGYRVLEEINVRPNVTYLARLRNKHPENPA
jgi:Fe-S-cluster-containing dehydrogenase component/anaerobic selenocysteine-containing dehydrogenase